MKKFLKEIKWFLIGGFFAILIICALFLFVWRCEDQRLLANNIIQASAIIILVTVTLSYAYYTRGLVEQEKNRLQEDKKKKDVDFRENSLQKFIQPLQYRLNNTKQILEKCDNPIDFRLSLNSFTVNINAITEVLEKFGYLCHKDLDGLIQQLGFSFSEIIDLSSQDLEKYNQIKVRALSTLAGFLGEISEQNNEYVLIVNDYYKFKKDLPNENTEE